MLDNNDDRKILYIETTEIRSVQTWRDNDCQGDDQMVRWWSKKRVGMRRSSNLGQTIQGSKKNGGHAPADPGGSEVDEYADQALE